MAHHIISAVLAGSILCGCALYPAVQVAGQAMTGYDAAMLADEYLPRTSVAGGERTTINHDRMLQRRLRERLGLYCTKTVTAYVINANAYLIGSAQDRQEADYTIRTASTVGGLRTITCKFYHTPTAQQNREGSSLRQQLKASFKKAGLAKSGLHIETVGTNAIIIGRARDSRQKALALDIASRQAGLTSVVDYIAVPALVKPADPTAKLATSEQ